MSYILSAGTVTIPMDPCVQERLDLGVTAVEDFVVLGRITECETDDAIVGAIVKAFYTDETTEELVDLVHTFSGCDGYYMLRIPAEYAGQEITIMAVGSECLDPLVPCECPPVVVESPTE